MADKRAIKEQREYIRETVPNPEKKSVLELPISHEEFMAARFFYASGPVDNMKGKFFMKSGRGGTFSNKVDIEKTYNLLAPLDADIDEEEAKKKRNKKKERDDDDDDRGCCGAWYCCPFRCSWKILCSFFG